MMNIAKLSHKVYTYVYRLFTETINLRFRFDINDNQIKKLNEELTYLNDKINRIEMSRLEIFEIKRVLKKNTQIIDELDLILFDVCNRLDKLEAKNNTKKRKRASCKYSIKIRKQPARKCKQLT